MDQARHDVKTLANSLTHSLIKTLSDASQKIGGDDAAAALARGKVFQLSNYLDAAISSFQTALAREPELDEARARLAQVQSLAHQPENALATAMELVQSNPGYKLTEMTSAQTMTAMTLLGDVLVRNNRVKDATEAYKVAASRYKDDTFAAGRLAQAYLVSGQPQKAMEAVPSFASNPRFVSLQKILTLGRENEALLPKYSHDNMQALVSLTEHGRPMVVDGTSYVAPLVAGAGDWCAGEP